MAGGRETGKQAGQAGSALTSEIQIGGEDAQEHEPRGADFAPVPTATGAGSGYVFLGFGSKGEILQSGVVRLPGHIADDDHDDRGDERDQDAEVLKIDVVDDPEERAMRVTVLRTRRSSFIGMTRNKL